MLLFVGQIFRVNADDFPALITSVGKNVFVTFYAIRMVISQNIPLLYYIINMLTATVQ